MFGDNFGDIGCILLIDHGTPIPYATKVYNYRLVLENVTINDALPLKAARRDTRDARV